MTPAACHLRKPAAQGVVRLRLGLGRQRIVQIAQQQADAVPRKKGGRDAAVAVKHTVGRHGNGHRYPSSSHRVQQYCTTHSAVTQGGDAMQLMIAARPPEMSPAPHTLPSPMPPTGWKRRAVPLPMPRLMQGGLLLLTGADGVRRPETAAGWCRSAAAGDTGTVIVPFPAPQLVRRRWPRPLYRAPGWSCGCTSNAPMPRPAVRVLVNTALSGGISKTGCPPAAVRASGRTASCWTSSACGWTSLSPVPLVRAYR